MDKRECCRAVFAVLEGAHDENGTALVMGDITRKRLEIACSIIAEMDENAEAELVQTVVCAAGVSVVLECDDELMLEDGKSHPFFSLISKFDKFSFSKAKDDRLRVTLTLDKPWVS